MYSPYPKISVKTPQDSAAYEFDLHNFFPYQVRIYYRAVSDAIAQIYGPMYNLGISEWRVMAVLSPNNVMSASEIVKRSSMNKVNVSRATQSLQKSGLLKRDIDGEDKRFSALRLTGKGNAVFQDLLPHISKLEKELRAGFSDSEIQTLISMMERIRQNAEKFISARQLTDDQDD